MYSSITLSDFIILPFVLMIVYAIAYNYRNKHYRRGHPYRKHFIRGLTLKIAGAIFIGLIYEYYYKGGDTMNYFYQAKIINSSFFDSPLKWLNLLLHIPDDYSVGYYQYTSQMMWYSDPASYTVAAIAAFLGLPVFSTYLPIAVIFAGVSFTGMWALFRTFAGLYPKLIHPVAIACLYIPSVLVWGSGIFKDTICLFGLGWLTYGTFQILIKRNYSFANILLTLFSFYIVGRIKVYILIAFMPALLMWILFSYTQNIKSSAVRFFVKFFALNSR